MHIQYIQIVFDDTFLFCLCRRRVLKRRVLYQWPKVKQRILYFGDICFGISDILCSGLRIFAFRHVISGARNCDRDQMQKRQWKNKMRYGRVTASDF